MRRRGGRDRCAGWKSLLCILTSHRVCIGVWCRRGGVALLAVRSLVPRVAKCFAAAQLAGHSNFITKQELDFTKLGGEGGETHCTLFTWASKPDGQFDRKLHPMNSQGYRLESTESTCGHRLEEIAIDDRTAVRMRDGFSYVAVAPHICRMRRCNQDDCRSTHDLLYDWQALSTRARKFKEGRGVKLGKVQVVGLTLYI